MVTAVVAESRYDPRTDEIEALDARLTERACRCAPLRRALARIAGAFVERKAWEPLGFARLADYARERPGLSARELYDFAHVDAALAKLPAIDRALTTGQLGWTMARLLCRVANAGDEARWLAAAGRVSAAALEAMFDHCIDTWWLVHAPRASRLRARRLALHGAGLHVAEEPARASRAVPLGGRQRRSREPHDALRGAPPARRPRGRDPHLGTCSERARLRAASRPLPLRRSSTPGAAGQRLRGFLPVSSRMRCWMISSLPSSSSRRPGGRSSARISACVFWMRSCVAG